MILLASATLMSSSEIPRLVVTDESHVRKVIHERGFASAAPSFWGRRPHRISTDDEHPIAAVAGARPDSLGVGSARTDDLYLRFGEGEVVVA